MATSPAPRPIHLADGDYEQIDAVMAVMDAAFPPCFGERWSKSQVSGVLPLSGVRLRIAYDVAGVHGFAVWRTVSDESELLLIAVHPDAQGRGIGRALVIDYVDGAQGQGAARLHLEVRDGNPAFYLYEACGFEQAGRRRAYYRGADGVRHDALTYVRTI